MKMLATVAVLVVASRSLAEPSYYGIYVNGVKTGYSFGESHPEAFEGKDAIRSDSHWENSGLYDGKKMTTIIETTSWATLENHPIKEISVATINGQKIRTETVYKAKTVEIDVQFGTQKVHQSADLPAGEIYADTDRLIREKIPNAGQSVTYYSFESGNLSFAKIELKNAGPGNFKQDGKEITGNLIVLKSKGGEARYYVNSQGESLRTEYPMGMVVLAEPKEKATSMLARTGDLPEILELTSLRADRTLEDGLHLERLRLMVTGRDLSDLPSDEGQSITKDGDGWLVDIHPMSPSGSEGRSLAEAKIGAEKWMEPSVLIPSDDPKLRNLAKKIVGKETNFLRATTAVRRYVHKTIRQRIDVQTARDALQILHDRTGKCTDLALLTTSLLRAAGIPARLASGLITNDGTFYYHSWSEAWDGHRWFPIDSVMDAPHISAGYLKLSQGNVDNGFNLPMLDPQTLKIHVVEARQSSSSSSAGGR